MDVRESYVPVPWGHVAVKLWGDPQNPAVFLFHGSLDNAGSFDRLIPLLPPTFYYICLELPGQGKSTHYPTSMLVHAENDIYVCVKMAEHFNRDNYILMAHSYGGHVALTYAQLYPERVSKLILLDTVGYFVQPIETLKDYIRARHTKFLENFAKSKSENRPTHTYEEAIRKSIAGRDAPVSWEAAECIVKRMLVPAAKGKYHFWYDQKLKFDALMLFDGRYGCETLQRFPPRCPTLIIIATKATEKNRTLYPYLTELEKLHNVTVVYVDGHHDVHLDNPDVVAPHVSKFLMKTIAKL